jgi:GT2 family glycosyltransferase
MRPDRPLVAVSILNWNAPALTERCLESLFASSYARFLPIVVDNGSREDCTGRIREWFDRRFPQGAAVRYDADAARSGGTSEGEAALAAGVQTARLVLIRSEENRGFAGGNNLAIAYALRRSPSPAYMLFLNNDARVERECLERLVAAAEEGSFSVVGASITSNGKAGGGKSGSHSVIRDLFTPSLRWTVCGNAPGKWVECAWVIGACMLCSAVALAQIRTGAAVYWREELFLYGEDLDLCWRVHEAGGRVAWCPEARAVHDVAASSGGRRNPIAYYYETRNRFHLARWYLPARVRALWYAFYLSLCLGRIGKTLLRGDWRALRSVAGGSRDGILGRTGKWDRHDVCAPRRIDAPAEEVHAGFGARFPVGRARVKA